jgi:RimJ/RimL family protein N-acetyltransferase
VTSPEPAIVPPSDGAAGPAPWHVRLPGATATIHAVPATPGEHAELLHGWLHQPHVRRWWSHGDLPTTERYIARQRASAHLVPWVVSADGRPFGYVETYRAADDPLARAFPLTAADRGWHVLVGPPDAIGSGLPRLLGRAVVAHLLARPGAERVVCEPDERNERMIAFCHALGHRRLATLDLPDKRAALLACTRADFAHRWPGDAEAAVAAEQGDHAGPAGTAGSHAPTAADGEHGGAARRGRA